MEDRRRKGLCFWGASKYTLGQKCAKSQLYQLLIEVLVDVDSGLKSPNSDDFQDCHEKLEYIKNEVESMTPILSLHAINGS